ncbi:short-chain-enoyl-CoA hydratase [Clostridium botulinum C]|uniref:short-chain-enoyl-CoA hydratase n=3 Tax=Clostridium botulinum TaxID=1491 RepID=A0A9Q4TEE3_CLOBO|nr:MULTISPECIES: short-chain-enoyl-CoA hydratase [Clostridium]EES92356.1 3-hydroxybutyryl-CoA dehydratase [Clostridium botulinum D str. 1873]KEI10952.1 crotonase [Clostridium sp. K25]MBO3441228.1 short-chain-enoyl-CoA hydratase [Clostridium haemolyticum]MCD3194914.1 short-chain-enoyl-CoA hydratase [Clostridium botulinum C]MCD3201440.1 short-chain-enoyl-CoA hydratase [Clostridium botulinum C]
MEHKNVLLEKENNIAIVTINRPEALNALNTDTLNELDLVVDEVAKDDDILVVILTGAGEKAFVAGADISEMKDKNVMEGRKFGLLGNKIFRKVETLEKPVIAAVNGFALGGGCELSMACDIRIASQKAKFGQPEVSLGITPGFGGTQRLARHIGMGMAKELIYSAKNINADEAFRIGLVNKVVAPEELMKEAKKLANEIAGRAPIAVKLCKQAINRGIQVDIDTAINIEAEIFGECFSTEDQKDAMTAFVEKRKLDGFKNR